WWLACAWMKRRSVKGWMRRCTARPATSSAAAGARLPREPPRAAAWRCTGKKRKPTSEPSQRFSAAVAAEAEVGVIRFRLGVGGVRVRQQRDAARVPGLLFAEQPPVIFLQVHAHGAPLGQRARTALEDTHV